MANQSIYRKARHATACLYAVVTAAYGFGLGTWNARCHKTRRGVLVVPLGKEETTTVTEDHHVIRFVSSFCETNSAYAITPSPPLESIPLPRESVRRPCVGFSLSREHIINSLANKATRQCITRQSRPADMVVRELERAHSSAPTSVDRPRTCTRCLGTADSWHNQEGADFSRSCLQRLQPPL
ncbi:unnamed protein product [Bemisia tabaci]|uniref:Uncharacterized protein n=1 Tax=Bemisia tabaci TaxID=7038 RepID=A0A9P0F928_BEMTA|nr:unnamed protein product [Bemisia tabaci]